MPRGVPLEVSDINLANAVKVSTSWRGVMRHLGYATTNGRLAARLRTRVERLELPTGHFRGQRTWSDEELAEAISISSTWGQVLRHLDLADHGTSSGAARSRATRLGIDFSHIDAKKVRPTVGHVPYVDQPKVVNLRFAAPALAAAWFLRRGYPVSYPAEPCSYDLIADVGGFLGRVQVKTATSGTPGQRMCRLKPNMRYREMGFYDPSEIDFFFIIDADMQRYLVPIADVAGQGQVSLATLAHRGVEE